MQAVNLRSAVPFGFSRQRLSAGFFTTAAVIVLALAVATPATAAKAKHHGKPIHATLKLRHAQVTPLSFAALNGWSDDDQAAAFKSFLNSCDAIRHATPRLLRRAKPVYRGLYKVCQRALAAGTLDREAARKFFEDNFKPVRIAPAGETQGFYTGYYEAEFAGSRFPSDKFTVPLYRIPKKWEGRSTVFGQYTRAKIEDGVLAGKGLEICWIEDPIDKFFAQIQGSARVKLDTGKVLRLNYIASNGKPYYPVGKDLIERGIVSREDMSMDRIREWMKANPEEGKELRRKNRSYVFFTDTGLDPHEKIEGAQGVPLTALRSLAVDRKIHVYGTPIWVEAELPIASEAPETPFNHLLIAQDTGSAIIGPARADIYFGRGEGIDSIAGRIKQHGRFVMLVPRELGVKGDIDTPLPRPKPPELTPDEATTLAAAKKAMPLPKSRPQVQEKDEAKAKPQVEE